MFRDRHVIGLFLFACVATGLSFAPHAQNSAPLSPSFDVASIKLHPGGARVIGVSTTGSRLSADATSVRNLIVYAYDLKGAYQVPLTAALRTLGNNMYDIEAEVDGARTPSSAQFRQMLRSLLAQRFDLQVHDDTQEMSVYELLVAKTGPKFKESRPEEGFSGFNGVNGRNQSCALTAATMDVVTSCIYNYTDRPVLDKTGLGGTYDVKLEATPQFRIDQNPDEAHDISILVAVSDQLGLKLQSAKDPVAVIVVDRVAEPSPN